MSVIVELALPADAFELGRILTVEGDARITLETMVPLGNHPVPFFRLHEGDRDTFEAAVGENPAVADLHPVTTDAEETLYGLDWQVAPDSFLEAVVSWDGHLLEASGGADSWAFELRFPSHSALSAFQEDCLAADVPIEVTRIYNPTDPDAGPWYGLTPPQREMLIRAVEAGYYALPRGVSTQDLADEFDISDQAVTERLRRAISTLVTNTLLLDVEQS